MSKIVELTKYRETKEFQTIISKCKNRQDNLTGIILQAFGEGVGVDNKPIYSNHDVNYQRMKFTLDRLSEIKSDSEGAKLLKSDMESEIERTKTFLTLGIRDQYGFTNSTPNFSELDLLRCDLQDNRYFQTVIDTMITALEKKDGGDVGLTSNDLVD